MTHDAASRQTAAPDLSGQQALDKVKQLLEQFQTAMMVTRSGGHLRVRPMPPMGKAESFEGILWFFTDDRSRRIGEMTDGQPVSLIFQDDRAGLYLHLIGRVVAADNGQPAEELGGPLSPYLGMVRFDTDRGYFWENPGGTLRALAGFTKAPLGPLPGSAGLDADSFRRGLEEREDGAGGK